MFQEISNKAININIIFFNMSKKILFNPHLITILIIPFQLRPKRLLILLSIAPVFRPGMNIIPNESGL